MDATFQRAMNIMLEKDIDKCAVVYLDDMLDYSKTVEENMKHFEDVMECLKKSGLKLNDKK